MTVAATVALVLLVVGALLCLGAALRRRSLADRAVATDAVAATVVCGIATGAVLTGDGLFVDLALVLCLLGFLATVTVARYLAREQR